MDLYMICNGDVITNCGTSDYTPGFRKEEFVGKTYKIGVRDFIGLIKADPNLNIVGLGAMIAGEEDYESYRKDFDEGKNEHYRQIDVNGAAREKRSSLKCAVCPMRSIRASGRHWLTVKAAEALLTAVIPVEDQVLKHLLQSHSKT